MTDTRNEEICIQDIIDKCMDLSLPAAKLEITNEKKSLEDLKRGAREIKRLADDLYRRLKDEVEPEVIAWHEYKPKGKPRGKNIQDVLKDKHKE